MTDLTIDGYQQAALTTAIYRDKTSEAGQDHGPLGLAYVALGLVNEAVELAEKIDQGAEPEAITAEAGDVLWYVALLSNEMRLWLSEVLGEDEWTTLTSMTPSVGNVVAARDYVIQHSATIAGLVKKSIRDDGGVIFSEKVEKITYHLKVVVSSLATIVGGAHALGEAAEKNAAKLADRRERNVLTGSGDSR